jgi:hypothetical protein
MYGDLPDTAEHAEKLLAPVTLGCKTKVGKIIGISISALQRLVALGGVPTVRPVSVWVAHNI